MSMSISGDDGYQALLPIPDVLRTVPISRAFFYKLVKSGRGPVLHKIGDRTFVSRENLSDWIAQREVVDPGAEVHAAA
jgi:predicted DNA-binding transcriptional regulator AlpA